MQHDEIESLPVEELINPGDLLAVLDKRFPTGETADLQAKLATWRDELRVKHLETLLARAVDLRSSLDDVMGEIEQFVGCDAEYFAPDDSEWAWEWTAEYLLAAVADVEAGKL